MTAARRVVGIIGGSGIPGIFRSGTPNRHQVSTPWGPPSGPVEEGAVGDLTVLFLSRHGLGHTIPPHRVNYRANIDALRSLGAEAIVAVNSVGSLKPEVAPGAFVLPHQFVDFTRQRPTTFFDGGRVFHVSLADPFCPDLRARAKAAGREAGVEFLDEKTYVCVEGPRFSTRAESRLFQSFADIIGMTLVPEVTLARERAICYACLAMVTDYDVWAERPVEASDIVRVIRENTERMGAVLDRLIPRLAAEPTCACAHALDHAAIG